MPQHPPPRILLVEDDPAHARLFQEAMRERGHHAIIDVAADGEEALSRLCSGSPEKAVDCPNFIVLDCNLPRYNGWEVLEAVKRDPKLRRIPVMVLTTSDAPRDVERAYDLHANCYVKKPLDLDEFFEAVRVCERFWLETATLPQP